LRVFRLQSYQKKTTSVKFQPDIVFYRKHCHIGRIIKGNADLNSDWLEQLSLTDSLVAQEIGLRRLRELTDRGVERLHQLVAIDSALKSQAQELAERYVDARRLEAEYEARLWAAGNGLHEQLARDYLACMQEIVEKTIAVAEAPALVARIFHHLGRAATWYHYRYIFIPEGWWLEMHKLYAFAERENFATKQITLYPDEAPTTCTSLYLRTLLLETPNRTNMTKRQIENIYHWLLPWAGQITLDKEFREDDQLFYVDLRENKGGQRIRNFEPTPTCRYWSTDAIIENIEHALNSIENGTSQITGLEPELLHQLYTEWSRTAYKRQRRAGGDRSDIIKRASVANGIYSVCQEVHTQATTGNAVLDMEGELWQIENEGRNGFGASVSTELNAWLKVGRLIALREETNLGMSVVGVVRSLKLQDEGKVYAGIEVLSHIAIYASLQELHSDTPVPQSFPGIFISSDDERELPSSLVLPAIEYQPDAELRLRLDRKAHHIRLSSMMEQKDDWVRVEIKVLGAAT
jgi:hypothetical protein